MNRRVLAGFKHRAFTLVEVMVVISILAAIAGIVNTGSSWAIIFWAEQYVPSGLVAVFGAASPIWTAVLAHFLVHGDRLSPLKRDLMKRKLRKRAREGWEE